MDITTILILGAIILFCSVFYFILGKKGDGQDPIFTEGDYNKVDLPEKTPVQGPHMAYQERSGSIWSLIIKSGPKMISKIIISFAIVSIASGYLSIKNAERFADIGADISQGDFISAVSSLFSFGREPAIEFKNVATGNDSYLSENGLTEFAYIGKKDGIGYAVLENPYSTQHHDPELSTDSSIYNNQIRGMTAEQSKDLCQERYEDYNGDLVSVEEWDRSQSNFLGKNNFSKPDFPEWTRTEFEEDDDFFYVIQHGFDLTKYLKDGEIESKENGKYVDGDEPDIFLLRCSINWEIKE